MSNKAHWRRPHTYLRAVHKLGGRVTAGFRSKKPADQPRVPPHLVGSVPPYSTQGPALSSLPFLTRRVVKIFFLWVVLALMVAAASLAWREMRSSEWQAKVFSDRADKMR